MTQPVEPAVRRRRLHRRTRRAALLATELIAVGVLAAGCGSSPSARTAAHRPGAQALAYSRCMRSHGVPSFPDPTISASGNHGSIGLNIPAGLTASPAFSTAQQACGKLAPGGPGASGAAPLTAKQQAELVTFAACMRSHGVPSFPDPSHGAFNLAGDINQSALQTTIQKCQVHRLPINISQGQGPQ